MTKAQTVALAVLLFLAICEPAANADEQAKGANEAPRGWSAEAWQNASPESQGMSSAKLEAFKQSLAAKRPKALLIVRNDKIVYEWYAEDHEPTKKHGTASLAKALVGGLSLAVALSDGRIKLDDPVAKHIPQWRDDPRKSKITVRQLGSHTSGLDDAEEDRIPHEKLTGWKGDFWKRLPAPNDPFTIARDKTSILFEPGTRIQYSNAGIALMTYCVTATLRDAPEKDVRTLLRQRLMRPLDVPDKEWSVGYGQTFDVDGLPLVGSWGGGAFTARATARIGQLLLHRGSWNGQHLLSEDAVRQVVSSAGLPGDCGMGWWTNAAGRYPWLPKDASWGAGAGDQILLIVPSLNLILVRNGEALAPRQAADDVFAAFHDRRSDILFKPLIDAMADKPPEVGKAPYPPSEAIVGIEWASRDTIVRQARGSDNWPITWGDDDKLYTAYGDGQGFEGAQTPKLSLGFAAIEGKPPAIRGINIRSATLEQKGDDRHGKKASGLLMVDGVLYLWARNAGNSQLAWSTDHGKTWQWSGWKFTTSFGCPTFLNFGKNYAGARDEYVYVYSHDHASAYQPANRMVLARVPKDRLKVRAAYEFFERLDNKGQPIWSVDSDERGAVFEHTGRCYRGGVTYNAGLKRYLWVQILPASRDPRGPRFEGGFGIYDAPEPWGPWTTVFFTEHWDIGPGETASFPTKWMSGEGRLLHLSFSGDDCFSVRAATLNTMP